MGWRACADRARRSRSPEQSLLMMVFGYSPSKATSRVLGACALAAGAACASPGSPGAPAAPAPAASTLPTTATYWVYVGAESADLVQRIRFDSAGATVEKTIVVGESPVEMEG